MKLLQEDKKMRLLFIPLIIMVLIHIPVSILIITDEYMDINLYATPDAIKLPFLVLQGISVITWAIVFYHIHVLAYIGMVIVYTAISWNWIIRKRIGNKAYFIIWFFLCVLSIILYWRLAPEYHSMLDG